MSYGVPQTAVMAAPLVSVKSLAVSLPGGAVVVHSTDLELRAGEIVALLGPSGSGKTTVLRALLAPEELIERGYTVSASHREIHGDFAFIPQRGALLDHLDIAGNIALAQSANGLSVDPSRWLVEVELDPSLANAGRSVTALSGGQAQRVAVARTLAAGRKLLVLDEPSVGLDPSGVRALARLLVRQARAQGVGVLLITHDLSLAGGAADRVLFLDPSRQTVSVMQGLSWQGPAELSSPSERTAALGRLEAATEAMLLSSRPLPLAVKVAAQGASAKGQGALRMAGGAMLNVLHPKLFRQAMVVLRRATRQAFVRPLVFYLTVGLLMGITVPYVVANLSLDLRPAAMLRIVGGTYILSLAPPLSAILFAATSGNAVNAWLGGLQLNRQVLALEGLGVSPMRYLFAPAWAALAASYLVTALLFTSAMLLGGYALFTLYDVPSAFAVVSSDFLSPAPTRVPFLLRGAWLVAMYAGAMASIVVSAGGAPKDSADEVTRAMTSSVIRATLFVVVMELASIALLFALTARR